MRISDNVHAVKHPFLIPISPDLKLERFVYSFFIFGKKVHLIDSGVADSEARILDYITGNGYSINDIQTLILTHSHPDHVGSAASIKEKSDCQILAHSGEREWIEDVAKQFSERPVPGFNSLVRESVKIDRPVDDNESLKLEDGITLNVIHAPGHSKGSISLLINGEILVCADCLLLPGDLPIYENIVDTVLSINRIKSVDQIKWLLSSWDDPCSGDQIRLKFQQSLDYLRRIHKEIKGIENAKELSPMDLCKKVIGKMKLPPPAVNPLVAKSFQSNLENMNFEF